MALQPAADSSSGSMDDDESGLIWAIRYLEVDAVEKLLEDGATLALLASCGWAVQS